MPQFFAPVPVSAASHWVDGILFCILLFYGLEGLFQGAIAATFDFIKFVASFLSGLLFYGVVSYFLAKLFHMPKGYGNAIGFFLVAFFTELFLYVILRKSVTLVNRVILSYGAGVKRMNTFLGVLPGILSGVVLVMFLVTVLTALPVSPFVKRGVADSTIGSFFAGRSEILQKNIASIFGGATEETLNFLTVEPQSNTSVSLGFTTTQGVVDEQAEEQMFTLVNTERQKRDIAPLTADADLVQLARKYAQEMLARGYFSHYTPEGLSPFDRMNAAHIPYSFAGENLAFSANLTLAMQGLMNSTGHRENILSTNYHKIGIGAIDAGIYGEMFVQEFTD